MSDSRIDFSKYIVLSIWFGCNNNCSICMLSGMKETLPPIGFDNFKRVLKDVVRSRRFTSLILSGAEVTTFRDLDQYVRFAASLKWFRNIQIQTNGRMLKDRAYLRHLVSCGVNEFFVSIHGLGSDHDTIVRCPDAFADTIAALAHLESMDVKVITNTVLTLENIEGVPNLFSFLFRRNISEVHLWNYYPMERTDTKHLVVSMNRFRRLLPEIVEIAGRFGKPLVLKSFPECLSIGPPGYFDSVYPETVLPSRFWRQFDECGFGTCVHRGPCENQACWGLSEAYVHKYGDEKNVLEPMQGRVLQRDKTISQGA